jgi:hypothetical protein
MHLIRGCLLGVALACATVPAYAQNKVDNIGNGGGIVIGGERLAGVYHTTSTEKIEDEQVVGGTTVTSEVEVETSTTTLAIFGHNPGAPTELPRLALDYFVVDGFSVGGSFVFARNAIEIDGERRVSGGGMSQSADIDGGHVTLQAIVFHPRTGYALAFNEYIGIWPRAGFSYTHIQRAEETTVSDPISGVEEDVEETTTITLTHLTLEGLLFVSPFPNFAFIGGPFADIGLGGGTEFDSNQPNVDVPDGDSKLSAFGFIVGVAGYFDTR